jgi:hypothetical protein
MAVVPAWDFPGADGDYAYLPALALASGMRTGAGFPARTVIIIAKLDDTAPGSDMVLFSTKRASNDAVAHAMAFDDGSNRIDYTYGTVVQTSTANNSVSASTWYAFCYCDAGNGGNITVRIIPLSTATQSSSASAASGGSFFDDGQTQQIDLGAYEAAGVVNQELLNGQIAIVLVLDGTALSQSECEAFAADPLVYGDTLCQTYGTECYFWDDSGIDVGDNFVGAPTLVGGVTRDAAGGPDIPERTPPVQANQPTISSVGDYGIIFNGEIQVVVTGTNFGTTTGIVGLTNDQLGTEQVEQDINSWSATEISFNCDLGDELTPGQKYLFVTNQTVGDDFGQDDGIAISVLADPGAAVIGLRQNPAPINLQASTPVSLDMGSLLYKRDAQEELTYSASGLPTGATINSATGVISGTPSAAATYSPSVTVTDGNGDTAVQAFSWVVSPLVVVPPDPEDPDSGSMPPNTGSSRRATRRSI